MVFQNINSILLPVDRLIVFNTRLDKEEKTTKYKMHYMPFANVIKVVFHPKI